MHCGLLLNRTTFTAAWEKATVSSDWTVAGGRQYRMNSSTGVGAVREWGRYREEVAALQSHIPVCNDNLGERRSAP